VTDFVMNSTVDN